MKFKPVVTNVILTVDLCDYLDQQTLAIRRNTGVSLNRSELLRGVIAGLQAAKSPVLPA